MSPELRKRVAQTLSFAMFGLLAAWIATRIAADAYRDFAIDLGRAASLNVWSSHFEQGFFLLAIATLALRFAGVLAPFTDTEKARYAAAFAPRPKRFLLNLVFWIVFALVLVLLFNLANTTDMGWMDSPPAHFALDAGPFALLGIVFLFFYVLSRRRQEPGGEKQ